VCFECSRTGRLLRPGISSTGKAVTPVVLFATPTFDKTVSVDFHTSMLGTYAKLWKAGIPCDSHVVAGHQWVDVARNQSVDHFLNTAEFTDLVFIDSDQGWDPKVIERIVRDPHLVVCALPPKKTDERDFHMGGLTGKIEGHLFEGKWAGTGLMRIKREVFAMIDARHPDLKELMKPKGGIPGWPHTPYFQTGNTKYGKMGEDVFFCNLVRDVGEFIWIDSDVNFTHIGKKRWTGNLYEHLVDTGRLKVG
jgi:hypothetical protein